MPAASPALARSTNSRVRSSGFMARSFSDTDVSLPSLSFPSLSAFILEHIESELQQIVLLATRIRSYGTEAVGVLRRGRRGGELHPRRRAGAHQPVGGERADPPAGARARRDP